MKIPELTKDNIDEYFTAWAVHAGETIDKKAEKEGWDNFDFASAINFVLIDVAEDVKELLVEEV